MTFGIGPLELIILAITGLLLCGVPIAVIVLLVVLLRKQPSGRNSDLETDDRRLRRQLESQRDQPGK